MTDKIVDYYLSLESPWSYLGDARLHEIAARHGALVRVKPVDLGQIFPKTGGLPLAKRAPARQAYRLVELARWAAHLDRPITLQPKHFPVPERSAALLVVAAGLAGEETGGETGGETAALASAILAACWAGERDVSSVETLKAIANDCGLDGAALLAASGGASGGEGEDAAPAERYAEYTSEALEIGVFGAPTYVYEDEMFWGQDRLDFLDRALAG